MRIFAILGHRVRGVRVIDLGAIAVLIVLVLVVYMAKAGAGATRADIDTVQQQIQDQQEQIRLLRAEVASEEQPERLAALSQQYLHMQPIPAAHDIPSEALADVARSASLQPAVNVAPAQAQASPSASASPVQGGR